MLYLLQIKHTIKACSLAALLVLIAPLAHCAEVSQEFQLKGAFLFNFARFISWPQATMQSDEEPIHFCVIGTNPFGSVLSKLENKKIQNHPIKVFYLNGSSAAQKCHLAFYHSAASQQHAEISAHFSHQYTLNISDDAGFIKRGGDIEFIREKNKIKFIINNSQLKKRGLRPRASLLELATEVR